MKHLNAIAFALVALALSGCKLEGDRYQITASNNAVYRVDTQTGEVVAGWLGENKGQVIIPASK